MVRGSVVHVARCEEPGAVEAGILLGEDEGEIAGDYLGRILSAPVEVRGFDRMIELRGISAALIQCYTDQVRDFDEVFFAHYINKRPASLVITP